MTALSDIAVIEARADAFQHAMEVGNLPMVLEHLREDAALTVTVPSASVMTRADFLALLPDYVIHLWVPKTRQVTVDGDTALVMTVGVMHATVYGIKRSGTFVMTDCWRRADGVWRLWQRHSTPLSSRGPTPGGVDVPPAEPESAEVESAQVRTV